MAFEPVLGLSGEIVLDFSEIFGVFCGCERDIRVDFFEVGDCFVPNEVSVVFVGEIGFFNDERDAFEFEIILDLSFCNG